MISFLTYAFFIIIGVFALGVIVLIFITFAATSEDEIKEFIQETKDRRKRNK